MNVDRKSETPEFDRIADEVVRGQRVMFLAPGIGAFIAALLLTLTGLVLTVAPLAPLVFGAKSMEESAVVGLIGVQVSAILLIIPAVLLMRGNPTGPKMWRAVVSAAVSCASLGLIARWRTEDAAPLAIACACLGAAFVVLRTVGFGMITIFRQRIKARREAYLAEIQVIRRS